MAEPLAPAPGALVVPDTHVAVLDPGSLVRLEQAGFALGRLVFGTGASSTRELRSVPGMKSILGAVAQDVVDTKRHFPLARVTSIDGFRQFDPRWLDSDEMSLQLTGVFNRLDRRAFYQGTCGEVRFVYRLGYETQQGGKSMRGRLPMSVNVVFLVDETELGCEGVARSWQSKPGSSGAALVDWLTGEGALGERARRSWTLKSVETNLQTIRLQSTVHTSLAGHIEYAMHVFHARDESRTDFFSAPMENMPDVARLERDEALFDELLAFVKRPETLNAIDRGTLVVPERFLATEAVSFSPRALTRLANRPFRQLFRDEDFAGLDLSSHRTIGSPKALLRRLDGASCTGCHQSRTIAGFHHVGMDPESRLPYESLLSGASSHLEADLERRREYTARLARGEQLDEFRPIPERQGVGNGYGAPCGLGDPGFSDWTCAEGFRCQRLEDEEVGTCLDDIAIGAPCEWGSMRENPVARRDRVGDMKRIGCEAGFTCSVNLQGFPLGECGAGCRADMPGAICGDFLDVDGYQNCLRAKISNDECVAKFAFPTAMRRCDVNHPCRQDYVCVRTGEDGVGGCVPPYFVFPLRNDGYPLTR